MTEKFCLKWNDFSANVSRAFGVLKKEDFLQDVTLVGEDNYQVAAHKLVLSSCSEYFKNIFKRNPHSHPLLCLEGLTSKDLTNVLNYIYDGEVNIYQDDLDRFLTVARRLKLAGLLGDGIPQKQEKVDYQAEEETVETSASKVMNPNAREKLVNYKKLATTGNEDFKMSLTEEEKNNLDEQVHQYVGRQEDGLFICSLCGKTGKQKIHIKNHIEAKHLEGIEIPCPTCGKIFRSNKVLYYHKIRCPMT